MTANIKPRTMRTEWSWAKRHLGQIPKVILQWPCQTFHLFRQGGGGIGSGSPLSAPFQPILNDRIGQTLTSRLHHAMVDNKEQPSAHAMAIELPIPCTTNSTIIIDDDRDNSIIASSAIGWSVSSVMSCYRHSHLMLLASGLIELHTTLMDRPRDNRSTDRQLHRECLFPCWTVGSFKAWMLESR